MSKRVIERFIHKSTPKIVRRGFLPQEGDCANYAVALKNVLGKGQIECSWEDDWRVSDGEPAHCALRFGNVLYDSNGSLTRSRLHARAGRDDDPDFHRHTDVGDAFPVNYRAIFDAQRSSDIEKILSKDWT